MTTATADAVNGRASHGVARALHFSKMHGAGNDFVVLDLRDGAAPPDADLCRALADRHVGVGCDQVLTIESPRSAGALAAYRIWNADGSSSRQCGNGARCVAAWLVRDGEAGAASTGAPFTLDSPAGAHVVDVLGAQRFRIAMGVPRFAPDAIPLAGIDVAHDGTAHDRNTHDGGANDTYTLDIDGVPLTLGAVSIGNPHAVIEVEDVDAAPVATVGMAVQQHVAFPESANVGFAQVIARDRLRLRVYERGAGETLACGSGACAAAAVLMRRGRLDRAVTVALPGGELQIAWPDDGAQITLAGPAAFVFDGDWIA